MILDAALAALKHQHPHLPSLWLGNNSRTSYEVEVDGVHLRVLRVVRGTRSELAVEGRTPRGFGREYTSDLSDAGLRRAVDLLAHRLR